MHDTTIPEPLLAQLNRTGAGRLALRLAVGVFQIIVLWQGLVADPGTARVLGDGGAAAAVVADEGSRRFPDWLAPCEVEGSPPDALCGSYEVWENRSTRHGRRIGLFVAVLPANGDGPVKEPVFPLAGGPGQAASEFLGFAGMILGELRASRDIVMVDQRGTGRSHPLDCDRPDPAASLQEQFVDYRTAEFARRCLARQDADVSLYTTEQAVDDLDEIRRALGYERIDLFGGSYGTRAALHYLRRHPGHTRSVFVDGVSPSWTPDLYRVPRAFERALEGVFAHCENDPECAAAYPELRSEWKQALGRFEDGPVQAEGNRRGSDAIEQVTLTHEIFTDGLRRVLYSTSSWSEAARIVHGAAGGDFRPFISNELRWRSAIHDLSLGMLLSVTCSETVPFITGEEIEKASAGTSMGGDRAYGMRRACKEWRAGRMPDDWRKPFRSEVPVLLLSGDVDPATPHEMAAEAATHFPNGLHLIVPNRSHSPSDQECETRILRAFLQTGSVADLDTSCIEQNAWPPFRPPRQASSKPMVVDSARLLACVGAYEIQPGVRIEIVLEQGRLYVVPPGGRGRELLRPESVDSFLLEGSDELVTFGRNDEGAVDRIMIQNGPTARRVD